MSTRDPVSVSGCGRWDVEGNAERDHHGSCLRARFSQASMAAVSSVVIA